jgi:hypothetical protein
VRAFRTIAPPQRRIKRVERLRAKKKCEIYRLELESPETSVIAKRALTPGLAVERTVYESVLPQLPIPALRYVGFTADEDERFAWLFIEDAGDDPCSLADHASDVARWLGTLHGAAAELELASALPERGPDHYLEHLRAARATIRDGFDNPALDGDGKVMLRELVSTCDVIETGWSSIEAICADLPRTLVHGDLVARNLRLRHDPSPAVLAFDWECSGFGVPAADVYELGREAKREELSAYCSTASQYTSGIGEEELRLLLLVGTGFRLLASADWASRHLRHAWPERATATLRCYERPLREWGEGLAAAA